MSTAIELLTENQMLRQAFKDVEVLLEGCQHHTLFKIPPVSTIVEKLREIVERVK